MMKKTITLIIAFFSFNAAYAQNVLKNTIVFSSFNDAGNQEHSTSPKASMVASLLKNDLLYSSDAIVIPEADFNAYFDGQNKSPELTITGSVMHDDDAVISLSINDVTVNYTVRNGDELLKSGISELSQKILNELATSPTRTSYQLTNNWYAYLHYASSKEFAKIDDPKKQLEALEQAIDIDPEFYTAKLDASKIHSRFGIFVERRKILDELLTKEDQLNDLFKLEVKAADASANGNYPVYRDLMSQVLSRRPYELSTYMSTGGMYYGLSEMEEAVENYEVVLRMDPNNAKAYNNIGYAYSHMGLHDKAIENFQRSVDLNPSANAYDSLADGYSTAGFIEKAKDAKRKGIETDPTLFYLYGYLAYLDVRQGMFNEAEKNTGLYMERIDDPNNMTEGMFRIAYIHYMKKEYEEALQETKDALDVYDSFDIVGRNHKIHWMKALAHLRLGQRDEAQKELDDMEKLIEIYNLSADNYRTNLYKGVLHIQAEMALLDNDIDKIDAIVDMFNDPKSIRYKLHGHGSNFDVTFFNTMFGEIYAKAGQNKKAEAILLKALDHNPNFAMAHYQLWKFYSKAGSNNKASQHKQKFEHLWRNADDDAKKTFDIL